MTRDEILDIYKTLRRNIQKVPTNKEFHRITRVPKRKLVRAFRTYNELVKAAGDTPRTISLGQYYTDAEYLDTYGSYIRRFRELPVQSAWEFHGYKPVARSYTQRFRVPWRDLPRLFHAYAKDKPEWSDVITLMERDNLLPSLETGTITPAPAFIRDPGMLDFIPGGLRNLIELAYGNGQALAFERKCAEAFGMLGYEVRAYGQGKGRMPDGVAEDPINKYAVIYDAKSRKSRYTPGTDDRKVCEYIREQRKVLTGRGFDMVYFLTVSSEFGLIPPAWIFRVQSETGCPPSFITAENMLRLIAMKIRNPRIVDTGAMKRLFVNAGEIREKDVKGVV